MIFLARKLHERIVISLGHTEIWIAVHQIVAKEVRLHIEGAPPGTIIYRWRQQESPAPRQNGSVIPPRGAFLRPVATSKPIEVGRCRSSVPMILSCCLQEALLINMNYITIQPVNIRPKIVRLKIDGPKHVSIDREEVWRDKQARQEA